MKINRLTSEEVAKHNAMKWKNRTSVPSVQQHRENSGARLTGGGSYVSISLCLKFRNKLDYLGVTEFPCKARRQEKDKDKRTQQFLQLHLGAIRGSVLSPDPCFALTLKNRIPGPSFRFAEGPKETTWSSFSITPDAIVEKDENRAKNCRSDRARRNYQRTSYASTRNYRETQVGWSPES